MMVQQRIVHFSGDVQGVGFRYTAIRTAGAFDVTGYVRNLPDGRVECVVEGQDDEIEAFLTELTERMGRHVRRKEQQIAPYSGLFDSFDVRF